MNEFNFGRVLTNFSQLKRTLPVKVANDAQKFFVASWQRQGWDDTGVVKWMPRKKETKRTQGKAILVGTGKLRRAVNNSIRETTFDKVRLVIDGDTIPYAAVHNEGLRAGRGAGFIMPKRQFMGDSQDLRKIQLKTITKEIDKIWG